MAWQDFVFAGGQWVFIIALLPSILGKDKPALSTSVMTSVVLVAFAVSFATLSLWISAVSTACSAAAWVILGIQKHISTRINKLAP